MTVAILHISSALAFLLGIIGIVVVILVPRLETLGDALLFLLVGFVLRALAKIISMLKDIDRRLSERP